MAENNVDAAEYCINCRFWGGDKGDATGYCRFLPPVPLVKHVMTNRTGDWEEEEVVAADRPCVDDDDWCGQWQAEKPALPIIQDGVDLTSPSSPFNMSLCKS